MNIIKIQVKGYLKLLNDKNTMQINTKGQINQNELIFFQDETKHKMVIEENKITLIRENIEFKNVIIFELNKIYKSKYLLKEYNKEFYINIKTEKIKQDKNGIIINYNVLDSNESYEYKIEMR